MINIRELINPETDLEKKIIRDPEFIKGALYGRPRPGHPEGAVIYHIAEVLANVEKYSDILTRRDLRLIAIIHDTFKYKVDNSKPKVGENHHAMIARRFGEKYHINKDVLDIIELHDEAYNAWSMGGRRNDWKGAEKRMERLILRLTDENFELYKTFYQCDNETGDKDKLNFEWFCNYVAQ